jgi:cell wall-associated NlpC family hydrolase
VKGIETICRRQLFLHVTITLFLIVAFFAGCAEKRVYRPSAKVIEKRLAHMGYTVQVGAFSNVENAARLTDLLKDRGLEAFYFVAREGLYKVSFGNYYSKATARENAEKLMLSGAINEYYIVTPDEYAIAKQNTHGNSYIREEIVKTARSFIDVPYLWGGSLSDSGFDCSGLTMTVYKLNGLNLPRSSREQYEAGYPVEQNHLLKGDLVFFSTSGVNKVTHVGVYMGEGRFIHASGKGKNIRVDDLSKTYYKKRYVGGRAYL